MGAKDSNLELRHNGVAIAYHPATAAGVVWLTWTEGDGPTTVGYRVADWHDAFVVPLRAGLAPTDQVLAARPAVRARVVAALQVLVGGRAGAVAVAWHHGDEGIDADLVVDGAELCAERVLAQQGVGANTLAAQRLVLAFGALRG